MKSKAMIRMEKCNKLANKLLRYNYSLTYDIGKGKIAVHKNGNVFGYLDEERKIIRNNQKGKLQNEKEIIRRAEIIKTNNLEYPYNVRILMSVDCCKTFFYSGGGRFCKTLDEAETYKNKLEKSEGEKKMKNNFIDDESKIIAMIELSKKGFLMSYREITEQEYENTKEQILHFVRTRKELHRQLNENLNKEKLE